MRGGEGREGKGGQGRGKLQGRYPEEGTGQYTVYSLLDALTNLLYEIFQRHELCLMSC